MEPQKDISSVGSTKELIAQSFIISGGSNEAHALFIRGLALHLKLDPHKVSDTLKRAVENFNKEDINELMKNMGQHHEHNPNAKKRTVETLRAFKAFETTDIISALIPSDQAAFKILIANEDRYTEKVIDSALIKVWQKNNEQKYEELKAINAELGAYKGLTWWENTPTDRKEELCLKGRSILTSQF